MTDQTFRSNAPFDEKHTYEKRKGKKTKYEREKKEVEKKKKKKNVIPGIRRIDRMKTRVNSINEICYRRKSSGARIERTNSVNASRVVPKHAAQN